MSAKTETATDALIAELYKIRGKAEIVGGRIITMSPTGFLPGRASGTIYLSLREYERETGGTAVPDNVAFIVDLPNRRSFAPDAAYFTGPTSGMKFLDGAPDFAVEVRSENDYGPAADRDMAAKRADYFAAGTEVVWDVDLQSDDVIRVYRASDPENPTVFQSGQNAEAEPAVPGWSIPVDELFD